MSIFSAISKLMTDFATFVQDFATTRAVIGERLRELGEQQREQRGLLLELLDQQDIANEKLNRIMAALLPGEAVRLSVEITDEAGNTYTYEGDFQMIQNRNTTRTVTIVPKDADGNVAVLDGALSVTSNNPAVSIEDLSADGLSFKIRTGSLAGQGPVSLEGDARIGEGVVPVAGNIDITVPPGEAVTLEPEIGEEIPNS